MGSTRPSHHVEGSKGSKGETSRILLVITSLSHLSSYSGSRDSSVSIITRLRLYYWRIGVRFPVERHLTLHTRGSNPPIGSTQPPIQWVLDTLPPGENIYTYMHAYRNKFNHTHKCVCIHTYIHAYRHKFNHTYRRVCIHIHVYTQSYIQTHIDACIHTYIHTYIHEKIFYVYVHVRYRKTQVTTLYFG
jgi:hypothetical protein